MLLPPAQHPIERRDAARPKRDRVEQEHRRLQQSCLLLLGWWRLEPAHNGRKGRVLEPVMPSIRVHEEGALVSRLVTICPVHRQELQSGAIRPHLDPWHRIEGPLMAVFKGASTTQPVCNARADP